MKQPIQISGGSFASLEAMMAANAEAAVRMARDDHGMTLDYTPESLGQLETVLAARVPAAEEDVERTTLLWGGYYGEVFRRKFGAEWIMALYPGQRSAEQGTGTEVAMPALDIGGSHVYPLLKVTRRLTMGPGEDLVAFFHKVSAALEAKQQR